MKIKLFDRGMYAAPRRAYMNDAGADVYTPYGLTLAPGTTHAIDLGFGVEIPAGYAGFIFPRSGMARRGIVCQLPPIDPGYTGNVHAIVTNTSTDAFTIPEGTRIGQLVVMPVVVCDFVVPAEDEETRGDGAFGSTGVA